MNDRSPLVCICIPTYNAATTIVETIESILSQTYKNIVIHISDNASTDQTVKLIESFNDPNIKIFRHLENVGGEGNFNRCIEYATGDYTAIYHADDLYDPEIIAKQVGFLESHLDAGAVFTDAYLIDESSNPIGELLSPKYKGNKVSCYEFESLFKEILYKSNFLICPSAMLRTEIYKDYIKYWDGERFKTSSDLDVWLRVSQKYKVAIIREKLIHYRISSTQGSDKLRSRTTRSDLFLVIDDYISRSEVNAKLSPKDHLNYKWLDITDRLVRATNCYLLGDVKHAKLLITGSINPVILSSVFVTYRRLITFFGLIFLRFTILFGVPPLGICIVKFARNFFRKWL